MAQGSWQSQIIGNLVDDPKAESVGNSQCTKFKVAINQPKENVNYVNVSAFGKLGEVALQYLVKGSQVFVSGSHEARNFTSKNNEEKTSLNLNASAIQFLGSRPQQTAQEPTSSSRPKAAARKVVEDFDSNEIPF